MIGAIINSQPTTAIIFFPYFVIFNIGLLTLSGLRYFFLVLESRSVLYSVHI